MRYSSDLLYRLIGTTLSPELDGLEHQLEIPSGLTPILIARGPVASMAGFLASVATRESFINRIQVGVPASSPGAESDIVTFSQGLWEISYSYIFVATYTQAVDGTIGPAGRVQLFDAALNSKNILESYAINGVPDRKEGFFYLVMEEDNWFLRLQVSGTGVGQTQQANITVRGNRLL